MCFTAKIYIIVQSFCTFDTRMLIRRNYFCCYFVVCDEAASLRCSHSCFNFYPIRLQHSIIIECFLFFSSCSLPKLLLFCLHHLLLRSNKNTSNSFYWTKNVHRIVTSRYSTVDCWFNSAAAIQIVFVTWSHHPLIVMPEIQDEHIYADLCNAHTVHD